VQREVVEMGWVVEEPRRRLDVMAIRDEDREDRLLAEMF